MVGRVCMAGKECVAGRCVWQGVCMVEGACVVRGGHAWQEKRPLQRAMESYWNAFLFSYSFQPKVGLIRGWRLPLGNPGSATDTKLWIQYFLYQGAPIPHEIEKKDA